MGKSVVCVHRDGCACALKLDGRSLRTWIGLAESLFYWVAAFLLSVLYSLSCPTGFRPNPVLVLHPLLCPQCPSSLLLSPCPPLFSFLSLYEIPPYSILSLRPLSLGVAGEIRGCHFLQSAESGLQQLNPFLSRPSVIPTSPHSHPPHTNPHHGRGQRSTIRLSEKPPFCLLHRLGHFHLLIVRKEQTDTEEKKH